VRDEIESEALRGKLERTERPRHGRDRDAEREREAERL